MPAALDQHGRFYASVNTTYVCSLLPVLLPGYMVKRQRWRDSSDVSACVRYLRAAGLLGGRARDASPYGAAALPRQQISSARVFRNLATNTGPATRGMPG